MTGARAGAHNVPTRAGLGTRVGARSRLVMGDREKGEARDMRDRRAAWRRYRERHREEIRRRGQRDRARNRDAFRARERRVYRERGDQIRATWRRYYHRHRDRLLARAKAARRWRKETPEQRARRLVRQRAYRRRHLARVRNRQRLAQQRYARRHPERVLAHTQLRRARVRAATLERVDRLAVYARDGGRCHLCGRPVSRTTFTLDHVVALARGGPHALANVAIAHPRCNFRKGAR